MFSGFVFFLRDFFTAGWLESPFTADEFGTRTSVGGGSTSADGASAASSARTAPLAATVGGSCAFGTPFSEIARASGAKHQMA